MNVFDSEDCLYLLDFIQKDQFITQRVLSQKSGLSLGKVNYCIKALIKIGYLKLRNFQNSDSKYKYIYVLTPKGIKNKKLIAKKFLRQKQKEYDKLKLL